MTHIDVVLESGIQTDRGNRKSEQFSLTDLGNAELIADIHGDRMRYDHSTGGWLVWQGHWWRPDKNGEVH